MSFNSLEFLLFFCVVAPIFAVIPHRAQNRWLLLASYLFYASWDWRFLALLWISTGVDYTVGRALARNDDPRTRRGLLALSVTTNLGILAAFKYSGFFAQSTRDLLEFFGLGVQPFFVDVVLPVGISFYTFQTLSYTIDVYRGHMAATEDPLDFALFVAFFPQLVAGPIERASSLIPQIQAPRRLSAKRLSAGSWLILWGLFKKVVIADNLAPLVNGVYITGAEPTGPELWLATYAFAIQIYCDFSGYTDIARGSARILGFDLMLNFRLPYLATSPADFWRRWHISLFSWLRDYLFVPLGGLRPSRARRQASTIMVMTLGGLWHGAAWHFVAWGAFHGILMTIENLLQPMLERVRPTDSHSPTGRLWKFAAIALTFHLMCLGLVLFRADDIVQAGSHWLTMMMSFDLGLVVDWWRPTLALCAPLLVFQFFQLRSSDLECQRRWSWPMRTLLYATLLLGIVLIGNDHGPAFIYFQF